MSIIVALFAAHGAILGDWLIDDAGISLAYARNLWEGNGWVAQRGVEPVEGFSNPLWTAFLAPIVGLMGTTSTWAIKVSAFGFLCAGLLAMSWDGLRRGGDVARSLLSAIAVVICPPLIIWGLSGLENALFFFLIALAVASFPSTYVLGESESIGRFVSGGALAALLALTRPEGVLFALGPWIGLLFARFFGQALGPLRWRQLGAWAGGFVVPLGGYLLLRRIYFQDFLPNTYYAKPGVRLTGVLDLSSWVSLLGGVWGAATVALAGALAASLAYLTWTRSWSSRLSGLVAYGAVSAGAFLVLPADWMREFRFGSSFGPLLWWTTIEAFFLAATRARSLPIPRFAPHFIVGVALVAGAPAAVGRTTTFANDPDLSLQLVRDVFGRGLNSVARGMGVQEGSVLLPDIGGTLLDSELAVRDLAGLSDRRIARLLPRDRQAFCDLVFDVMRPTFVHLHGPWIRFSGLPWDPRWTRDYVWVGGGDSRALQGRLGREETISGDFVRRSELEARGCSLAKVRRLYIAHGAHLMKRL